MANETIVEYSVKIVKIDKNFYTYALSVQPGGSKVETKTTVTPDPGGDKTQDIAVSAEVETNPPETKAGQAMGIGQAMNIANDIIFAAVENAGMVK